MTVYLLFLPHPGTKYIVYLKVIGAAVRSRINVCRDIDTNESSIF